MRSVLIFLSSVLVLALNLFFLGPWLLEVTGPGLANLVYVGIRVLVVGLLAAYWVHRLNRPRFQAFLVVTFLVWIDQVVLKGWFLWKDAGPEMGFSLFVPLMMSYMLLCPIVVMMAWVGILAGESLWGRPRIG